MVLDVGDCEETGDIDWGGGYLKYWPRKWQDDAAGQASARGVIFLSGSCPGRSHD